MAVSALCLTSNVNCIGGILVSEFGSIRLGDVAGEVRNCHRVDMPSESVEITDMTYQRRVGIAAQTGKLHRDAARERDQLLRRRFRKAHAADRRHLGRLLEGFGDEGADRQGKWRKTQAREG